MPASEGLATIRSAARSFEEGLPSNQRKRFGQFFTGLPLGTLLAQLAFDEDCRSVIDPMAGHGDLLDAAATVARTRGTILDRLDGIEVDAETAAFCRRRTLALEAEGIAAASAILAGSAFDPSNVATLDAERYGLVIANPPYVRYQAQNGDGAGVDDIRRGLSSIVESRALGDERVLWKTLVDGYSGLADLSVPAWLLSALLTQPNGRLALVVPATWRTRDYADVVRYLLLRFFSLEYIVADTQPGWFSDALVRTHLIVARRRTWDEAASTLSDRTSWPTARWLQIAPAAASAGSLVGAAFPGTTPEQSLADWVGAVDQPPVTGIDSRTFALQDEWRILEQRLRRKPWFQKAEDRHGTMPLFAHRNTQVAHDDTQAAALPDGLQEMLPVGVDSPRLQTLDEANIRVSQGLRTGCNRFFYVTLVSDDGDDEVIVEASDSFDNMRFSTPAGALKPVLHRQTDMQTFVRGHLPPTRALDLSNWVLPEDQPIVAKAAEAYRRRGTSLPQIMPRDLATFVRLAATRALDPREPARFIPDLTAVRTNVRRPASTRETPRFWYMLPPFAPRHLPAIFVPRINHGTPAVALNAQVPILIDANFSTMWSEEKRWTPHALFALFRSTWCRAAMEATGTPLGGGALKLEATHIRQLPVPRLSIRDCEVLETLGRQLAVAAQPAQDQIDKLVLAAAWPHLSEHDLSVIVRHIETRLRSAWAGRQRTAP
ncbi:N-6 DNA methylase [Aminobacter sp. BE322]|uniref:N-6 DNA methylase n=1 Tax=unclassified Aminobacter TaxID=2644704 RepID=UPI003D212769